MLVFRHAHRALEPLERWIEPPAPTFYALRQIKKLLGYMRGGSSRTTSSSPRGRSAGEHDARVADMTEIITGLALQQDSFVSFRAAVRGTCLS